MYVYRNIFIYGVLQIPNMIIARFRALKNIINSRLRSILNDESRFIPKCAVHVNGHMNFQGEMNDPVSIQGKPWKHLGYTLQNLRVM